MKKNILITGNTGFIGKNIEKEYKKEFNTVYCWNRKGLFFNETIINIPSNMSKEEDVLNVLEYVKPDIIIHCVGNANVMVSVADPIADLESNYLIPHIILFAMKRLEMCDCRFIFLSSAAVYGNPERLPICESAKINPLSPYALHKFSAERLCQFMVDNYNFDIKILRIFSAYGPGLEKQLFWDMYKKIIKYNYLELWGSGEESRDYIYISDLINAIKIVVEKAPKNEIIYNIANGKEISIKDAAYTFCEKMGVDINKIYFKGKTREGEPINWRADISKLMSLGYKPKVSFEDGVQEYVNWLKG